MSKKVPKSDIKRLKLRGKQRGFHHIHRAIQRLIGPHIPAEKLVQNGRQYVSTMKLPSKRNETPGLMCNSSSVKANWAASGDLRGSLRIDLGGKFRKFGGEKGFGGVVRAGFQRVEGGRSGEGLERRDDRWSTMGASWIYLGRFGPKEKLNHEIKRKKKRLLADWE